jgi:hypothetical protein
MWKSCTSISNTSNVLFAIFSSPPRTVYPNTSTFILKVSTFDAISVSLFSNNRVNWCSTGGNTCGWRGAIARQPEDGSWRAQYRDWDHICGQVRSINRIHLDLQSPNSTQVDKKSFVHWWEYCPDYSSKSETAKCRFVQIAWINTR